MNPRIIRERATVDVDEEFVVFLIGMRINRLWKLHKWLPIALAMRTMVKELTESGGTLGYLGGEHRTIGNPFIYVQYWRSYQELEAYAADTSCAHSRNWQAFFRRVGLDGDVGIWHETYRIQPGQFECVYLNMPPFGLGKTSLLVRADGGREASRGRMNRTRVAAGCPVQHG